MILRPALLEDAPQLARLGRDSFCAKFAHLYDREDLEAFLEQVYSEEGVAGEIADPKLTHQLAVDEDSGALLGFIKLKDPSGYAAYSDAQKPIALQQLYTHPDRTGAGVGAALMDWVLDLARSHDKDAIQQDRLLALAQAAIEDGQPARTVKIDEDDAKAWRMLQLLTTKPVLYVCNVGESEAAEGNALSAKVAEMAAAQGNSAVIISAQIEEEISQLEADEAEMFLTEMGLDEAGLDRLIRAGYELLHLETYFTVGPKEARAWTIKQGTSAPKAAGVIHGDFEKGFIRAETIAYDDFVNLGGEGPAKEAGKMRSEGKSYTVKDGDVLHFLFNT